MSRNFAKTWVSVGDRMTDDLERRLRAVEQQIELINRVLPDTYVGAHNPIACYSSANAPTVVEPGTMWYQSGVESAGNGVVVGRWSSTSWDGDAKSGASGTIDLSATFGMPAGVTAVFAVLRIYDTTPNIQAQLRKVVSGEPYIAVRTQVSGIYSGYGGWVWCDSNGDIYFYQGADLAGVNLFLTAYIP